MEPDLVKLPDWPDRLAAIFGLLIMAWAQWGFPAEPAAAFAFGLGLVAVPSYRAIKRTQKFLMFAALGQGAAEEGK